MRHSYSVCFEKYFSDVTVCKLLDVGFSLCCYLMQICALQYLSPRSLLWVLDHILFLSVFFPVSLFDVAASCFLSFLHSYHLVVFHSVTYAAWQIHPQSQICIFQQLFAFLSISASNHFLISHNKTGQSVWSAIKDELFKSIWKKIPQFFSNFIGVMKSTLFRCFISLGVKYSSDWKATI